ncbi:response regulator transcription factor [Sphingopyxis sp. KK2]|uniref:response regulator transcription factor n=1 Tax=Sphingopyxis sp. KK2 TaxID=1855727 RepID=UPI00097E64D7|nr:response regulator [Sphingopyxis sp. KK2]
MTSPLIAVVDDDRAIRVALSSLLRSEGFRVTAYASAEDFLQSIATTVPDCLLTDIQMTGMSGLDLQDRLSHDMPQLPVFVMTAFPETQIRDCAIAGGAHCFLKKPFDALDLLKCIRTALAGDAK